MSRRTTIILIMAGIVLVIVCIKIMQTEAAKSTASETRDPNQIGTEMTEEEYVHWQLVQIEKFNKFSPTIEEHIKNPQPDDIGWSADDLVMPLDIQRFLLDSELREDDIPEKYKLASQVYHDGLSFYGRYWNDFQKYKDEGLLEKLSDSDLKKAKETIAVVKDKLANEQR